LSKVQRIMKTEWGWDGDAYEVSCAVESDGSSSPAWDLIEALRQGIWMDPDAASLPDDAQLKVRSTIRSLLKMLAEKGRLPAGNFNKLRDGVWEIKHTNLRLTFFDTRGDGTFVPKEGEVEYDWRQQAYYPDLPEFDDYIRLGHHFAKPENIRKTPEIDISESLRIRMEDLNHDKPDDRDDD